MYLKVYKPPFNDYGYIIFGKDSTLSFSENIDFVKIYKSETSSVSYIFNPSDSSTIFFVEGFLQSVFYTDCSIEEYLIEAVQIK